MVRLHPPVPPGVESGTFKMQGEELSFPIFLILFSVDVNLSLISYDIYTKADTLSGKAPEK